MKRYATIGQIEAFRLEALLGRLERTSESTSEFSNRGYYYRFFVIVAKQVALHPKVPLLPRRQEAVALLF
jgi:hypothetical protein